MVLEGKTGISYGSLSDTHPSSSVSGGLLEAVQSVFAPRSGEGAEEGANQSSSSQMTQDVYQRQPLLSKGEGGWETDDPYSSEPPIFYDAKSVNGVHRNGSVTINVNGKNGGQEGLNGVHQNEMIRIDLSAGALRNQKKYPSEYLKTLFAFLFVLASWFLTTISLALVHERVPDRNVYGPLPDVFLDNVPAADWALDVSEILIIISTASILVLVFFHRYRSIVMRRLFFLLGLLYLMRSITMYVTVLPVASTTYYCSPKTNNTDAGVIIVRALRILLGMGLSINGQHVYCGDYIYSGHTVILTVFSLVVQEYTPRKWYPLHVLSWVVTLIGVIFVMVAHGHYTIDVLIAYYITTRLWWIYHTLASNSILKQKGPANFLSRVWWYRIFTYFECNVDGVLPRRYQWPLPWPRQLVAKYPERDC